VVLVAPSVVVCSKKMSDSDEELPPLAGQESVAGSSKKQGKRKSSDDDAVAAAKPSVKKAPGRPKGSKNKNTRPKDNEGKVPHFTSFEDLLVCVEPMLVSVRILSKGPSRKVLNFGRVFRPSTTLY
jgi:hypothetical protein